MITSKENRLIKQVRLLAQKKYREETHSYLVEGYKMVKEAILAQETVLHVILCEETGEKEKQQELVNILSSDCIEWVSAAVFQSLTDTVSPQGILAVVQEKEVPAEYTSTVLFALDHLQDPGNLGTIIRTLDAAGYSELLLSEGTAELYNPKVVRSTMGSIFRLQCHTTLNLKEELMQLQQKGYDIVITSLDATKSCYDLNFEQKMVLVIGNEANGVQPEIQALANQKIKIPMLGKAESLNAAVATSILAYEGVRQKVASK